MAALASAAVTPPPGTLPELAGVRWRPLVDERRLRRAATFWTVACVAHAVPFVAAAVGLALLEPATIPVGLVLIAHAWAIAELYAARGAKALRPRRRRGAEHARAERAAVGLLGDLLCHRARDLRARTGLVVERVGLGVWLLGEAGAILVRPGGRRVHCFCVGVPGEELPAADRQAHLLLALREHEAGFATVANQAFSGAPWRVARRLAPNAREALREAVAQARAWPER
jgi:hypothetical protein